MGGRHDPVDVQHEDRYAGDAKDRGRTQGTPGQHGGQGEKPGERAVKDDAERRGGTDQRPEQAAGQGKAGHAPQAALQGAGKKQQHPGQKRQGEAGFLDMAAYGQGILAGIEGVEQRGRKPRPEPEAERARQRQDAAGPDHGIDRALPFGHERSAQGGKPLAHEQVEPAVDAVERTGAAELEQGVPGVPGKRAVAVQLLGIGRDGIVPVLVDMARGQQDAPPGDQGEKRHQGQGGKSPVHGALPAKRPGRQARRARIRNWADTAAREIRWCRQRFPFS